MPELTTLTHPAFVRELYFENSKLPRDGCIWHGFDAYGLLSFSAIGQWPTNVEPSKGNLRVTFPSAKYAPCNNMLEKT